MNTIETYLTLGKLDTGESHHYVYHNELDIHSFNGIKYEEIEQQLEILPMCLTCEYHSSLSNPS